MVLNLYVRISFLLFLKSHFFPVNFFFPFFCFFPPNPVLVVYILIFLSSSGTNSGAIKHNNGINAAREEVGGPKHRT